jgi:hypothetical protein
MQHSLAEIRRLEIRLLLRMHLSKWTSAASGVESVPTHRLHNMFGSTEACRFVDASQGRGFVVQSLESQVVIWCCLLGFNSGWYVTPFQLWCPPLPRGLTGTTAAGRLASVFEGSTARDPYEATFQASCALHGKCGTFSDLETTDTRLIPQLFP